jgi:hypothetical protein
VSDYCTVNDIEVLLGFDINTFASGTTPPLTQIQREIDQVTNEIDFVLAGVGITTQPTDTRILARLRNTCSYGVCCRVGMSAFGNNAGVNDSQPGSYCERYRALLDEIKSDPDLYGVISGDSVTYMSNQVLDGTITESDQNDQFIDVDYEV